MTRSYKLILISSGISIIIFSALFFGVSRPIKQLRSSYASNKPFVFFNNFEKTEDKQNVILKELSLIFDSEPIFIPTRWSESSEPLKNIVNDSPLFENYEPITTLYDQNTVLDVISDSVAIATPKDLLSNKYINPFSGINQSDPHFFQSNRRTATLTIQNLNNSSIVETREITEKPDFEINDQLWSPLVFLLVIDETLPMLSPLLIESSGTEEIDNFFKSILAAQKIKLSSLPADYYRATISP